MDSKAAVSIVRNDSAPDQKRVQAMLQEAIDLVGGIKAYVKPKDTVVIKTNIFAPFPPPVSVDRKVVAALVRLIRWAGASRVVVAEGVSVGTKLERGKTTRDCFKDLGIQSAVEAEGGEILCLEDDPRVSVDVPGGIALNRIDYPKSFLDADVFIELPCLKTHGLTLVTLGIKNLQGLLTDEQKYFAHRDDLDQKLVDIHKVRKADLTVIDGLLAMEGNGAGEAGLPVPMNILLAGSDVVAVDAVASACMGIEDVLDVSTTRIAQHNGLGTADLSQIEVRGVSIEAVKRKFLLPTVWTKPLDRYVTGVYSNVDTYIGGACRFCWLIAGAMGQTLARYAPQRFSLLAGIDPKTPPTLRTDLDKTILVGDCACSSTGDVKEIRNAMLLHNQGLMAPGCPPYRPAMALFEAYLIRSGLLSPEMIQMRKENATQKLYQYYQSVDPTWIPEG